MVLYPRRRAVFLHVFCTPQSRSFIALLSRSLFQSFKTRQRILEAPHFRLSGCIRKPPREYHDTPSYMPMSCLCVFRSCVPSTSFHHFHFESPHSIGGSRLLAVAKEARQRRQSLKLGTCLPFPCWLLHLWFNLVVFRSGKSLSLVAMRRGM